MDSDIFHEALTVLLQRQMVKRTEGIEIKYVTNHDRMRETVYKNLEPAKLKGHHLSIADTIEAVYAKNLDVHFADLGRHYSRSDNKEKAIKYCIAAGNQAKEKYANELAIEMFQSVMDLLPQEKTTLPLRLEVSEKLGDCYTLLGRYQEAKSNYEDISIFFTDKYDKARLTRKIGDVLFQKGELAEAADKVWNALNLVGSSKPRYQLTWMLSMIGALFKNLYNLYFPLKFRLKPGKEKRKKLLEQFAGYLRLAYIYYFYDPMSVPLMLLRSANIAERLGPQELIRSHAPLSVLYSVFTFWKTSKKIIDNGLKIAIEIKSEWDQGSFLIRKGIYYQGMAENKLARDCNIEAIEKMLKLGDLYEICIAYIHLAIAQYYLGELKDMQKNTIDAIQLIERTGAYSAGEIMWAHRGLSKILIGESIEEGQKDIQTTRDLAEKDNNSFIIAFSLYFKGNGLMATGMTEQALDAFEECKKLRKKDTLLHDYIVGVYGKIGHMCLEKLRTNNKIDKKERNQQLKYSKKMMNKAKSLSKRHPNFKTHAILVTALYNWIIGKKKKAYKLFKNSRQVAKDNSMRLALAEAYYEEGRGMLDDGGQVASRGREHIEKALMLYKECGAMVYIPRLEALLGGTSIQKDA